MAETHQISLPMESIPQDPPPMEETPHALPTVQPQRTTPVEATQQDKPARKQRLGRRKIPMQRIQNDNNRLITFSKRKAGIYKKAMEISTLCGTDIGILIFSPAGNPYAYGLPNIESISDRFLRGEDHEDQNDYLSRIVMEDQRRAHVGKLNKDCDELSMYFQNLKREGKKLMDLKKHTFDGGCWWDIPVEDLTAYEMQVMTVVMEEIKKNASKRLKDLRVGASSSSVVVQPEDIKMGGNVEFGYVDDGVFGEFTEAVSSSVVPGVQGGNMEMGGNLGQGYRGSAGDSGGVGDWRAGGSMAVGIHGGGFQVDGNAGLGGGGLGYGVASSFVQVGGMLMGGNGGNGYGGCVGDFVAGGSSSKSVQQGGTQTGKYGGVGFGGCDVSGGGIGRWRPVELVAASSAVQRGVGSMLVGGDGGGDYGGGVASGGGLSDGWMLDNSSPTILGVNPTQMAGNGGFANFGGGGGGAVGCVGRGGLGDWDEVRSSSIQMGGNGGFGYGGFGGGASGEFGSGGCGGGGCSGDFMAGGSLLTALQPDQDQMGGTSNRGSLYDGGGEFGTNNGFGALLYDGGSEI